ncbi:rhomboid family intramembrane serine protease [Sediminibacterium sp. C3]|uniref:rhomboid family intramembrane serine protease n=1 Tax=Sediminibacterium sp. C3 TaxID=1267211 RepID=UPI00040FAC61|nr:rhomboid family intramembrane serine protease [Sediminibacterium sp. C3]
MITITLSIILLTSVISFTGFSNQKVLDDLIFYPPAITNRNQWYRFITSGLIHADIMHLLFNMYSFYLFGDLVERTFVQIFGESGKLIYLILYIISLIVCLLPTYFNNQNNYHYRSLGASGAVSAVIFAGIFLYPTMGMGIFPIPFHIPGFVFGPLYLILSAYLAKKGHGNINHSAHIWGAIFGIVFLIITTSFLSKFNAFENFINAIKLYIAGY